MMSAIGAIHEGLEAVEVKRGNAQGAKHDVETQ